MTKFRTCHPVQRRRAEYDLTIAELVTELRQRADDASAAVELSQLIAAAAQARAALDDDPMTAVVDCWRCGAQIDLDTEPFVFVNVAAVSRVAADGMTATAQRIYTSAERFADGCEAPELVLCVGCGERLDENCDAQEARPLDRAELVARANGTGTEAPPAAPLARQDPVRG